MYICAMTLSQDNYTALHLAVESGKPSVVESLLGHGAQGGNSIKLINFGCKSDISCGTSSGTTQVTSS